MQDEGESAARWLVGAPRELLSSLRVKGTSARLLQSALSPVRPHAAGDELTAADHRLGLLGWPTRDRARSHRRCSQSHTGHLRLVCRLKMATSAATRLPAVAVLGMGGVGGVLAASLSTAGRCRLSVVARGAGHAWLCDEGLTVQLNEGAMIHCRPDVILDAEQLEPSPQDMVLVCTKSHQVGSAIPALKQLLGPETVVVPCINGMPWWYFHGTGGHHDSLRLRSSDPSGQLWEAVPPQRVLGTVGMVSGDLDRRDGGFTWRSKWPSSRNHITIGDPAAGGGASSRTAAVRDLFCSTTVPVRIEMASDIRSNIFDKLLINASLNTISTLTRTDCGQVVVRISARYYTDLFYR